MTAGWVRIRLADKETTLVERARWCDSFRCRLRGLMFRRRVCLEDSLVFVESTQSIAGASIHMFFVFCPIAAIWISEEGCIVDSRLAKPFGPLYVPRGAARYILEGPTSLLNVVHRGDKVLFEFLSR